MPAVRLSRRRKSSHAIFTPAKAGVYGVSTTTTTSRPVTFAPNVTPITYTEVDPEDDPSHPLFALGLPLDPNNPLSSSTHAHALPTSKLFPPSDTPAPPPTRKRCPPGKRRSQGYIPRPPNAFMLFRADFVRQKHVPGSIETNHGSLSKIIGTCWRQLPLEEKRVWEVKAKHEKAAHKAMFPDYRFRPVHNKNKHLKDAASSSSASSSSHHNNNSNSHSSSSNNNNNSKEKQPQTAEDERRCDEVAALLLEGKKGEELARAVRNLDLEREREREREREQRELELELEGEDPDADEYELGLGAGESRRASFEFDGSGSSSHQQQTGGLQLHMPISQHPNAHAFLHPYSAPLSHNPMGGHMQLNHPQHPYHRRSSSVPLPNEWLAYTSNLSSSGGGMGMGMGTGIALPAIPQFMSRPASPVSSIARFNHAFPPQDHFTNPFQHQQQQSFTSHNNGNTEYQFAPIPEFTPTFGAQDQLQAQQQQQQQQQGLGGGGLFHPSPQHGFMHANNMYANTNTNMYMQTSPRSSIGLGIGYRRASSAQPMLMRSWTMPSSSSTSAAAAVFDYTIERDPSPLPDVDPELFGDFSFGKSSSASSSASNANGVEAPVEVSAMQSMNEGDVIVDPSSSSSIHDEPIAPTSLPLPLPLAPLAHIDTSVPPVPDFVMHGASSSSSSSSSPSSGSSVSGSPATSILDLSATANGPPPSSGTTVTPTPTSTSASNAPGAAPGAPERLASLDLSAYMHLDGLYAPDPTGLGLSMGMGMGFGVYAGASDQHGQVYPSEQYAMMGGMGMGMYGYDGVDPVVSSSSAHGHGQGEAKMTMEMGTEAYFGASSA